MKNDTCSLPDCTKPVKRVGYCYGHYMKNWRYGTPTPTHAPLWDDIIGQRFGSLVVIERVGSRWRCVCDCGRERLALAGDLNRAADGNSCGERATHRRDDVGYTAAHQRCRSDRGRVQEHQCTDCGNPAQHWSYNHDDPDERLGTSGRSLSPVAYSLDPSHYSPRCVPCHKRFDLHRADSLITVA